VGLAQRRATARAVVADAPKHTVEPSGRTLADDVLALQMEDHYVRVHRPGGSELILMPLTRAIAAVTADGLRTHRSWRVARHAVVGVDGDARAMRLRLANGLVDPVARSAVTHLRAAGWLAAAEELRSSSSG
jgi:DNA-binding LytR/AlgR family response regulator